MPDPTQLIKLEWSYWPGTLVAGLVLLLALAMIWGLYRPARHATRGWRLVVLNVLRLALVTGILACLLDPHLVREIRLEQPTRLLLLVDTTRSMAETDGGTTTRLDRASRWWHNQASDDSPVQIAAFDEKIHLLGGADPWTITPTPGTGTSLASALRNVAALPPDPPIGGVILISDGRVTDGESPLAAARILAARGIPVSTLTLGKTDPKPALQIDGIDVAHVVAPKTSVRAVVSLQAPGFAGQQAHLRLRSGDTVLAEQDVPLTGSSQSIDLNFVPPETPSLQICTADLDFAQSHPGIKPDSLPFALRISKPKIRVLYMEGTNSPPDEILYVQRALQEGDSGIQCTIMRRQQSVDDNTAMQTTVNPDDGSLIYNVENPVHGYPRTMQALLDYDVVIFSDVRVEGFTKEQLDMTEKWTEEYGGGFMMVGGITSFGSGGYDRTVIDKIMPVSMEDETGMSGGAFKPVLTPDGAKHPIMQVGPTPEETKKIWDTKMPNLYGFQYVNHLKPGAVCLLQHPTMSNDSGPYIILAAEDIGKGRSVAYTSDTTAAWGTDFERIFGEPITPGQKTGLQTSQQPAHQHRKNGQRAPTNDARYFKLFWNNTVRWLAEKRLALRNGSLTVETSKSKVGTDENFNIRVSTQQAPASVNLQVTDLATQAVVETLVADLRPATHDYAVSARLHGAGNYLIDIAHNSPAATQDTDATATVGIDSTPAVVTCDKTDPELVDVRADPALMAEIAKTTGGQVLTEDQTDARRNISAHTRAQAAHVEFQVQSVWDQGWILAALASLLIGEWLLRRRWSLI